MTEDAPLISMGSPDRCPSCGADMTPDQHYCVECGNRRGKPRFSIDNKKPTETPPPTPKTSTRRISSGATLLLGILVLMLALWTGVQLGNHGTSSPASYQRQPKINIYNTGGGSGAGASTTASSNSSGSGGSGSSAASKPAKGATKKPSSTQKTVGLSGKQSTGVNIHDLHTKAQRKAATNKVLHQTSKLSSGKQIGSEKTTLGSKCSDNTVGCTNGKYTGSYFGG